MGECSARLGGKPSGRQYGSLADGGEEEEIRGNGWDIAVLLAKRQRRLGGGVVRRRTDRPSNQVPIRYVGIMQCKDGVVVSGSGLLTARG